MFYAHFVLSKKGPLARIWLAAHWDKKLTKAHVFETNVPSCVDSIIHPKVKMALRTSGHLLLGVVRIHSRKAKYLLADCNEAFVKIKMAFRPGVVDLPEENREAAFTAITLPEVFHDFDTSVPDLNDAEVQKQFTLNQSRVEEITMKEDLGSITLAQDDGFGDLGFDEREIMRDAQQQEESMYKTSRDESHLLSDVSKRKDATLDTSLEKPMDLGLDEPMKDDGFGGEMVMGEGLLGGNFMETGGGLFDEQPEIPAGEVSMGPEVAPTEKQPTQQIQRDKDAAETETPQAEMVEAQAPADQTTLVPNEEEAFALEPIDITAGVKETRQRRKRKLVVDEIKELAGDLIKSQLKDTSDIVSTLDLAPPTKKLMLWKETGGAEKLFNLPGRQSNSDPIIKVFTKNLTPDIPKDLRTHHEPLDLEDQEPERMRDEQLSQSVNVQEQDTTLGEDQSMRARQESSSSKLPDMSLMSVRRASVSSGEDDYDAGDDLFGPEYDDDYDIPSVMPQSVDPQQQQEEEEDEEIEEREGENTEEREERILNKRAHQMLTSIRSRLAKEDTLTFSDMTRKQTRKQVAAKFYTLLVLKKQQAVNVQQISTFADINITPGPAFNTIY
ncbi:double-strand-break repair protein rad21 homolog isoform X1 [Acanthaster planci]|uniref:Double-strand-break repair protein rad21 homolog isoform X1 n=1 Tax=Acanthaster planci TaxID=133434 RepID=A0A8B7ZJV9_ACAPL|nr:double-strand-break repair protein rad21 homolog isoform X1 [Acanthaster planci]